MSYLKEFIKNKNVGAVSSSSKSLGKKIYENLDLLNADTVVEFGAGEGVFTTEILKLIGPECKFFIFETNKTFYDILKDKIKDKRAIIINDSAEKIGDYLVKFKIEKVNYIISSLPLSLIPVQTKNTIIQNSIKFIRKSGQYIQFQYTPYDYKRLRRYFKKVKLIFTFFNFPPVFVYRCYI